jgi:peptidoglycan/LPS O-acetylase OafA/YrhL
MQKYRPDIDGLRALAVVAVILFHTFPNVVPGGFVGVDIFFVISGYLITQIILSDLERGTFSAATFYARRVRRIFPALIVVLVFSFVMGWHLLLPAELISLCKNIVAGALFSANLMLLSEVGYFDIAAHTKPLLHLWSLGIEEQFYLVWPLLLCMLPRGRLVVAIAALLLASFALNLAMIGDRPSSAFYLPFTRAWELMAGALLTQVPALGQRNKEALGASGLALVVASLFLFDASTPFPGWATLAPVIGTAFLILSEGSLINRTAFEHRTAVNVGLISYPLYLWHWPLLVFAELYRFKPLTDIQRGLLIGATFVLAWLTYKLLELPIRRSRTVFVRPLGVAMAGLAIIAAVPSLGFVPRLPDAIAQMIATPAMGAAWRVHECMLLETDTNDFSPDCADKTRPLIAIWGDSTAAALVPGFRKLQETEAFGLAQFTVTSCHPVLDRQSPTKLCAERNRRILDLIGGTAPDLVLLHAGWGLNDTSDDLRPTIEALRSRSVAHIVILGPVPVWRGGLPNAVAAHYWRTGSVLPERTGQYFDRGSGDESLRKAATGLNVEYISARDAFCNAEGCVSRVGNALVTSDTVHLTEAGSGFLVRAIIGKLRCAPRGDGSGDGWGQQCP